MRLDQSGIGLLQIENEQIVEARLFSSDQNADDAFWGTLTRLLCTLLDLMV